jgi:hypothetical protein
MNQKKQSFFFSPGGNGTYISSGPKIPNWTYTDDISDIFHEYRISNGDHTSSTRRRGAEDWSFAPARFAMFVLLLLSRPRRRRYPAYRSLSRRRVALGAGDRDVWVERIKAFLTTLARSRDVGEGQEGRGGRLMTEGERKTLREMYSAYIQP